MTMKPKAEKYRIRKPAATADLTSQAETAVSASPQTETGAEIPDKQRIVQGQTNQQQIFLDRLSTKLSIGQATMAGKVA